MNARPWLLLLVLVLVPPVAAQTTPTSTSTLSFEDVTVRLSEQGSGVAVSERYELLVSDAASFNTSGAIVVRLDADASEPIITSEHKGQSKTLEANRVQPDAASSGQDLIGRRLDLAGLHPVANGDTVIVVVGYNSADTTYHHGLAAAADSLLVFATGAGDNEPSSTALGEFNPTGNGNEGHAARSDAPAGFTYSVTFAKSTTTAPSAPTNMNPWVYGLLGLVVGFALAWFLFARKPKAKKFQKGGEMESGAMLEARRRTLMAALKELEIGHEAKEIPDNAYAPLKEEYKAQTVRVLRSLEDKRETPKP